MERRRLIEIVAWRVVDMYDPYELADVGGDEWGLFCETCWMLEERPAEVLAFILDE